jgi:hypothetical protein
MLPIKGKEKNMMEFLQAHWHCLLPLIAIALVLLLHGLGGKKDTQE